MVIDKRQTLILYGTHIPTDYVLFDFNNCLPIEDGSIYMSTSFLILNTVLGGDMMRKSIVYDKKTPNVFYCPLNKPTGFDKLFVHSRPLKKLCEFDGKPLPEDYKSDCFQDVDETEYACKEKYRIMMRLHPPGTDDDKESTKWEKAYKKVVRKRKRQQSQ